MKLTLYRKWLSEKSTIGEIHVNGGFFCFSLEDCLRAPGVKIPGQTAIPAGTYDVILNFSERFQRIMPLLANVPNFSGIRIHSGNTDADTSGCILVGRKHVGKDSIAESRAAYADLFNLLNDVYGKEKITIEIVNPQSAIRERIQPIPITAAQQPTAAREESALINEQEAPPSTSNASFAERSQPLKRESEERTVRHEVETPRYSSSESTRQREVGPVNRASEFDPASPQRAASNAPASPLADRIVQFINGLSLSRIVGALSALATAASASAALIGDANPALALKVAAVSGIISAFCGRIQGPPKGAK